MIGAFLLSLLLQDASARLEQGRALMARDDFAEAARVLAEAATRDPRSARVRYYLGVCHMRLGRLADAIDAFERARELSERPNPALLYELGSAYSRTERYRDAAAVLEIGRDLTAGDTPMRLQLGWAYYQLVEGGKAAAEFQSVLDREPQNPLAHLYMGLAQAALGKLGDAEARFRTAIELDPNRVDARLGLGRVLSQSGRRNEARSVLEGVVTTFPAEARPAHNELGLIALGDGDTSRAAAHFEAVVTEDPDHRQATYNLWLLYARLGRADEAEAMRRRFESLRGDASDERSLSRTSSRKP